MEEVIAHIMEDNVVASGWCTKESLTLRELS